MSVFGILQILVLLALLVLLTRPLGAYMARVFSGERTPLDPVLRPVERLIYSLTGVNSRAEMRWTRYTINMLLFNLFGILFVYGMLRLQHLHPWNPAHAPDMSPDLAFNTAVSFATNTNWQSYIPETASSYFSQMAAFTWQNFVSAGTGIAVAMALIRGLTRHSAEEVGNFWVDLTRSCLWILLPLTIVMAIFFMASGMIQNLGGPVVANTLEGMKQTIGMGPVASQEAIKILGTNGGGFFNANSAHPFENPTPLTNFVEVLAVLAIAAGLTYTFGRYARNQKQGWALFAAMLIIFAVSLAAMTWSEQTGNPNIANAGVNQAATSQQSGGNMEGKEVRFGPYGTALFLNSTTSTSTGAVDGSVDSLTPIGGGMAMLNIAIGENIFGGVGTGIMFMLVFALLAVFIAGLMVGRTPEYLGKKIESFDIKMASIAVLAPLAVVLIGTAIAVLTKAGKAGIANPGPHGFTEILYGFTSAANNNGSAFAGLGANSLFYNVALGLSMLAGRYLFLIPVLALAGSLAAKKKVPEGAGTLATHTPLFVGLVGGTVLLVGALTYLPALALGPVAEHFLLFPLH